MPTAEVQANRISYNAAISSCEKAGEWQRALSLFEAMVFGANCRSEIQSLQKVDDPSPKALFCGSKNKQYRSPQNTKHCPVREGPPNKRVSKALKPRPKAIHLRYFEKLILAQILQPYAGDEFNFTSIGRDHLQRSHQCLWKRFLSQGSSESPRRDGAGAVAADAWHRKLISDMSAGISYVPSPIKRTETFWILVVFFEWYVVQKKRHMTLLYLFRGTWSVVVLQSAPANARGTGEKLSFCWPWQRLWATMQTAMPRSCQTHLPSAEQVNREKSV